MHRLMSLIGGCTFLAMAALAAPAIHAQQGAFTSLFDGATLKGWSRVGDANWAVVDGAIQATSGMGFLVSDASYGDFQLTVEVWVDDAANSGVFFRLSDLKTILSTNSYEVNIWDRRPDPIYRTGAIVNVASPSSVINAGGKWNTFDITARGPRLTVVLNGTTVVDTEHKGWARGPLALQRNAGIVKFRSVRIRTL